MLQFMSHKKSDMAELLNNKRSLLEFSGGASGKEPDCQCRRHNRCKFDPWVGKIPRRKGWQVTPHSCVENSTDREPDGLQSFGLQRVGHDGSNIACTHRDSCYNKKHYMYSCYNYKYYINLIPKAYDNKPLHIYAILIVISMQE